MHACMYARHISLFGNTEFPSSSHLISAKERTNESQSGIIITMAMFMLMSWQPSRLRQIFSNEKEEKIIFFAPPGDCGEKSHVITSAKAKHYKAGSSTYFICKCPKWAFNVEVNHRAAFVASAKRKE